MRRSDRELSCWPSRRRAGTANVSVVVGGQRSSYAALGFECVGAGRIAVAPGAACQDETPPTSTAAIVGYVLGFATLFFSFVARVIRRSRRERLAAESDLREGWSIRRDAIQIEPDSLLGRGGFGTFCFPSPDRPILVEYRSRRILRTLFYQRLRTTHLVAGDVYAARYLGSRVACKVIRARSGARVDAVNGFVTEVSLMTKLHHPNIVLLMGVSDDVAEDGGRQICIVAELMSNVSLSLRVTSAGGTAHRSPCPPRNQPTSALRLCRAPCATCSPRRAGAPRLDSCCGSSRTRHAGSPFCTVGSVRSCTATSSRPTC